MLGKVTATSIYIHTTHTEKYGNLSSQICKDRRRTLSDVQKEQEKVKENK